MRTWQILYSGQGRKKAQGQRPQTMQTKHSLCGTAKQRVPVGGAVPSGQQHLTPAILSHPPAVAAGADGGLQSQGRRRSLQGRSTKVGPLRQGQCFQKPTFPESSLCSQVGGTRALELCCHAARAGPWCQPLLLPDLLRTDSEQDGGPEGP